MSSSDSSDALWLGVDLSTQSLTLVLLPDQSPGAGDVVYLDSVRYASDLPQYGTEHGMHISDGDDGEKASAAHARPLRYCKGGRGSPGKSPSALAWLA